MATQPKILPIVSLISSYWVRILFFGLIMGQIETIWIFLEAIETGFCTIHKEGFESPFETIPHYNSMKSSPNDT